MNYTQFAAAFHAHFTENPNACVQLGIDQHLDALPDPSHAYAVARIGGAEVLLRACAAIDRDALNFDEALDLELAALKLEEEIHFATYRFNDRTRLQQLPSAGDDIGDGIFMLFINDPRAPELRLQNIVARLEGVPAYLQALIARLDTPVRRWVAIERDKVAGLPDLFATIENWAAELGWSELTRFRAAQQAANAALVRYIAQLQSLPATDHFHLGPAICERIITLKGIDRTPRELHALAREFLDETMAACQQLRDRLAEKYGLDRTTTVAELHAFLNRKFRVALPTGQLDDILVRYRREHEKILAYIAERDLFDVFPEQEIKILRTPGFLAPTIPAGAMMSPPPFREGVRTSLVYLTLSDALIDEHTELGIPVMMIHEGIPGHHLQLASAGRHPSLIRRHIDAMHHAEGWTTMLEDYMLDLGYMGDLTDEARFCAKRDISRIGARVAIDLYFMSGDKSFLDVGVDCDLSSDDPFEAAGNLLQTVTGFSSGRVQAELNWYSQERGYPLAYLTGNRLVWQLKRDLAAACAGRLAALELDRTFHRIYLQAGNMPLRHLRRVFQHQGLLQASP